MNVTMRRKNEILEEVVKLLEKQFDNLSSYKYISVDKRGETSLHVERPITVFTTWTGLYKSITVFNLKITNLLLEISTDWEELCFELPKYKKEWESDVEHIEKPYNYGVTICCKKYSIAFNLYEKLQAQQKIYDIIAKIQYQLEPDWVVNPNNTRQYKYFLLFGFDDLIDWSFDIVITKDCRLYMSNVAKNYIIENNLITPELWKQAFC